MPGDGAICSKCEKLVCGLCACESIYTIGRELLVLTLEFTIYALNEDLRIGMIVIAGVVVLEGEGYNYFLETCLGPVPYFIGLFYGCDDACLSEKFV